MNNNHGGADAAIYARASTQDQGKGFSIPRRLTPVRRSRIAAITMQVERTFDGQLTGS
jgi:hypothetical protein